MKELIGREFRSTKYGGSDWTQKVVNVLLIWSCNHNEGTMVPIIKVGGDGGFYYDLTQVEFITEKFSLDFQKIKEYKNT